MNKIYFSTLIFLLIVAQKACTACPTCLEALSNDCPPFFTPEFDSFYQQQANKNAQPFIETNNSIDLSQSTTTTNTMEDSQ